MLDWSCPVEGRKAWEPPERFFQYFPITPRSISWGLYLSGAGCEHVLPGQRYSPSGHPKLYHQEWETGGALPEFQAIYVTRGAGVFESAHGGRHEIAAGDLIFAFPGVWHRYRPTLEVGWDEYWISANGEMLHRLLREGFLSPSDPVLKVGLNEDLVRAYRNLLGYVQAAAAPNPHVLAAHAMAIVGTVLAPPSDRAAECQPLRSENHGPRHGPIGRPSAEDDLGLRVSIHDGRRRRAAVAHHAAIAGAAFPPGAGADGLRGDHATLRGTGQAPVAAHVAAHGTSGGRGGIHRRHADGQSLPPPVRPYPERLSPAVPQHRIARPAAASRSFPCGATWIRVSKPRSTPPRRSSRRREW